MTRFFPHHKGETGVRPVRPAAVPPDFLGRTALPLLAPLPAGARVLLLIDRSQALVNLGSIAEARFTSIAIDSADRLPFGDASFACVVVDMHLIAVSRGTPREGRYGAVVAELQRVLSAEGQIVASSEPRRLRHKLGGPGRISSAFG